MGIDNLEFELRRFELSQSNDKINYEKHSYNGFLGIEALYKHLDVLYHKYFTDLRIKIDNIIANNNNHLILALLRDRINLFNEIKEEFEIKSTLDFWKGYIKRCDTVDKPILQRSKAARNEYSTVKFFTEMIGTQSYFIGKGFDELKALYENYGESKADLNQQKKQQQNQILQNKHSYIDEYFEKHFPNKDITNKEIELMFGITRPTIQEWREKGKLIMTSDVGKRPITYSKEKLIEFLKDGQIKDRLVNIGKS